MFRLRSLLLFLPFVNSALGVGFHGFTYEGLKEPEVAGDDFLKVIRERWIAQPLDHFNHRDNRTWSMRYLENAGFFNGSGPILIMLGGEWGISDGFLRAGMMHDIASSYGAMMFYTEHRYYGESKPAKDTSPENMQYLNIDQALADVAYFINRIKISKDNPVIVFGGSYAGNMAAWARLKYPHLIKGALASSAPVHAQADFPEYYQVVTKSLERQSRQCVVDVKAAFDKVESLLFTEDGPEKLKKQFNLCRAPDVNSTNDVAYFMNVLAERFASIVQYDDVDGKQTKIAAACDTMTNKSIGCPIERLARFAKEGGKCFDADYEKFVKIYRNESWDSEAGRGAMRQWFYQTCSEYGYYQTSNPEMSVFGSLFKLDFFLNVCTDLFGDYYDGHHLDKGVGRTNIMYGSFNPDVSNVIFTNGNIDPWHALSVLEDLNESSPAILIDGSSHCRDLYDDKATDIESLKEARRKVRRIIGNWITGK